MQETDGSLIARWAWTLEHLLHSCLFLLHTFVTSLQLSFSLSAVFISLLNERRRKKRQKMLLSQCTSCWLWAYNCLTQHTAQWHWVMESCFLFTQLCNMGYPLTSVSWAPKALLESTVHPPLWNHPKLTTTQQHPQADIHTSTEPLAWQLKYFHSKPAVSVKPSRADVASYTVCCFVFLLVQTLYKSSA